MILSIADEYWNTVILVVYVLKYNRNYSVSYRISGLLVSAHDAFIRSMFLVLRYLKYNEITTVIQYYI
jgi:hypothetical protein